MWDDTLYVGQYSIAMAATDNDDEAHQLNVNDLLFFSGKVPVPLLTTPPIDHAHMLYTVGVE